MNYPKLDDIEVSKILKKLPNPDEIAINIDKDNFGSWVEVGCILKDYGTSFETFNNWCMSGMKKYDSERVRKVWKSAEPPNEVTIGTLIHEAQKNGYKLPNSGNFNNYKSNSNKINNYQRNNQKPIEKQEISYKINDLELHEREFVIPKMIDFKEEMISYLNTMFEPDEYVNIVINKDFKGKNFLTADLIENLEKDSIENVIGNYDPEVGVYICINPLNESGRKDSNVTDYRYTLIECDDLPIDKQISFIEALKLPTLINVYSGGKSIHAIVKVNALDENEYKERVQFIQKVCLDNDFTIDKADKNPSRLTRLVGVVRGEKVQCIVNINESGFKDFDSWKEWIIQETEINNDGLPEIISLSSFFNDPPKQAEPIIDGILRKGHTLIIGGASKSGKTWSVIQLGLAVASGCKWFNEFQCNQGKVLFVNFEVDGNSFQNRIINVAKNMKIEESEIQNNFMVWNLRGKAEPLSIFYSKLINRCKNGNYSMIILDPIYKIIEGNENDGEAIAHFFNLADTITTETGACLVMTHHHSKGLQGFKNSMDRVSGSGVFARSPDCMIDFIQIDPESVGVSIDENEVALRMSFTLREFKPQKERELTFSYKTLLHKIIYGLEFAKAYNPIESAKANEKNADNEKYENLIKEAFSFYNQGNNEPVKGTDLKKYIFEKYGISGNTIQDHLSKTLEAVEKPDNVKGKGNWYILSKD